MILCLFSSEPCSHLFIFIYVNDLGLSSGNRAIGKVLLACVLCRSVVNKQQAFGFFFVRVQAAWHVPLAAAASCLFSLCLCFPLAAGRRLHGKQLARPRRWLAAVLGARFSRAEESWARETR